MPFRFKRQKTPFGEVFHKRGLIGSNLLITNNGRKLGLRYGEKLGGLLKSVKVDRLDNVSFSGNVHPVQIGYGVHAKVFRVFPKDEASFLAAAHGGSSHLPSVVLKVYRESVAKKDKPDGFTQFFANSYVFNYLENTRKQTYDVRPLHTYFVSEKILARKFINAPTVEELYRAIKGIALPSGRLSNALDDRQIVDFIRRNRISEKGLDAFTSELLSHISMGEKTGFGTGQRIVPDFGHWGNAFVLGRGKDGKLLVSIIDQGKQSIKGLGDRLRKGLVFPAT